MKKINWKTFFSLIIVCVCAFCVTACGEDKSDKATIVTNEGETVEMTAADLIDEYDSNEARFEKLYHGAKVTFTGTVKKVEVNPPLWNEVAYDGETSKIVFEEGWSLVLNEEDYYAADLTNINKGEEITVTTAIFGAPFNTDYLKQVSENERVLWVVGNKDTKTVTSKPLPKPSEEELIATAGDLNIQLFNASYKNDLDSTIETYDGNYYKVELSVNEIRDGYVFCDYDTLELGGYSFISIYLDDETLKKLHTGERYTFCGRMIVDKFYVSSCRLRDAFVIGN